MEFNWDRANIGHIARHKVAIAEAEQVIENDPLDISKVARNGELRTVHLGETDSGRVLVIVVTERDGMYRVVTARPANRKERAFYSKYKATFNEQDSRNP